MVTLDQVLYNSACELIHSRVVLTEVDGVMLHIPIVCLKGYGKNVHERWWGAFRTQGPCRARLGFDSFPLDLESHSDLAVPRLLSLLKIVPPRIRSCLCLRTAKHGRVDLIPR